MPNREIFDLTDKKSRAYLYHSLGLGEYFLGSDAITIMKQLKNFLGITFEFKNEAS